MLIFRQQPMPSLILRSGSISIIAFFLPASAWPRAVFVEHRLFRLKATWLVTVWHNG
jgi:hypothetical protein